MTLDDVRSLYAYNRWANARFVEVIAGLDEDRAGARIESSFPSILGTLAHLIAAEWIWLRRWKGENPSTFPEWLTAPGLARLSAQLERIEAERDEFVSSLEASDLQAPLDYRTMNGEPQRTRLLDLLLHVVNHSTYHRGQLTTMLRQVGATPVATDYVYFKRDGIE